MTVKMILKWVGIGAIWFFAIKAMIDIISPLVGFIMIIVAIIVMVWGIRGDIRDNRELHELKYREEEGGE